MTRKLPFVATVVVSILLGAVASAIVITTERSYSQGASTVTVLEEFCGMQYPTNRGQICGLLPQPSGSLWLFNMSYTWQGPTITIFERFFEVPVSSGTAMHVSVSSTQDVNFTLFYQKTLGNASPVPIRIISSAVVNGTKVIGPAQIHSLDRTITANETGHFVLNFKTPHPIPVTWVALIVSA